ncbi:carbon starvation protein A [Pseudoflavonifractor sp. DSM 107456]|uniref:Carbon starvation protein A n=2 Tax=Pseudoflavonifractor TaxID=1017280 RepID=A0ABR9RA48_9FIRM|nr:MULTISPECIES: carbon starvation CstA family protein [Eubacteriales]MBC5730353.1 carbon starvation protein A [Pseudoflavonifractor hominis]MBE5055572.1 carbon starvation protein A [Pseudoflavonifractor gallinarum]MBT9683994.1 carbon starvation protein A [Pseudoflavonifractor sp. MCC625]
MISFLVALVLLIVGFFTYSKLMEHVFHIDDRQTPAVVHPDGVDYMPMKTWRIFLIQLLNIAGLGPIYGALAGACWGPVVYLWIVFGTILGGGVHDFLSGMMSEREDGASISEVVGKYMGRVITFIMRIFSVVLLVLVGTTFSTGPAGLLASLTPTVLNAKFWLVVILLYYLCATFLPIDKIIGKLYPIFGICLIIMALGVAGGIIFGGYQMPELWDHFANEDPNGKPIWAMMFVSVACGAISGFHATQSPMMARCITSEKEGRTVFYGAMVAEGIIALIWAAAGVSFYNGAAGLSGALAAVNNNQGEIVYQICHGLLGPVGAVLAMIGVIACPITSGDTAFRSARLTIADWFKIDQSKMTTRLFLAVPLLAVGAILSQLDFSMIWRYFSWSNQTLAMIVLWTGGVFIHKYGYPPIASLMAAIPATFMSAVSITYFFQAPECLHLSTSIAYPVGIVAAILFFCIFWWRTFIVHKDDINHELAAQAK